MFDLMSIKGPADVKAVPTDRIVDLCDEMRESDWSSDVCSSDLFNFLVKVVYKFQNRRYNSTENRA